MSMNRRDKQCETESLALSPPTLGLSFPCCKWVIVAPMLEGSGEVGKTALPVPEPHKCGSPASLFLGCYAFSHTCQCAVSNVQSLNSPKLVEWGAHLVTTLEGPHLGELELWIGAFIDDKKVPGNVENPTPILGQLMSPISPQLTSNPGWSCWHIPVTPSRRRLR